MKICKQCGEQAPDEMLTCPKCGAFLEDLVEAAVETTTEKAEEVKEEVKAEVQASVEQMVDANPVLPAAQQVQLEAEPDAAAQKKLKLLILSGVAVIALLVLVLIGRALFSTSYKDPINKTVKLLNKQSTDVEDMISAVMPKFVSSAYKDAIKAVKKFDDATDSSMYDEMMESLKGAMDEYYADLEDEFGKGVKFSYKVKEKDKLSTKELKEIANNYKALKDTVDSLDKVVDALKELLKTQYDMKNKEANSIVDLAKDVLDTMGKELKNVEISEGYAVTLEIKIAGKEDEDKQDLDVNIVKMNGKWCLDILSIDGVQEELNSLVKMVQQFAK